MKYRVTQIDPHTWELSVKIGPGWGYVGTFGSEAHAVDAMNAEIDNRPAPASKFYDATGRVLP